jgi:hypothetical protein
MDKRLIWAGLLIVIAVITLFGCSMIGLIFLVIPMNNTNATSIDISTPASFSGNVTDSNGLAVQGALVSIIGDYSNYSALSDADGNFDITGIENGTYSVSVEKEDYTKVEFYWTFKNGAEFTYSPVLTNLCPSSLINTSLAYTLTTEDNGTMDQGSMIATFPFPDGSSYYISPPVDGTTSSVSIRSLQGNRVIDMSINANDGRPIPFELEVIINGTKTWKVFQDTGMNISEAENAQPDYFGTVSDPTTKKVLIDPNNPEIAAIAMNVKNEADSNDTWIVARALFSWLMRNTTYYSSITHSGSTYQYQSAVEVLHSGRGECQELSSLYASLLRAVGIPAREVSGYYMSPASLGTTAEGHEWVEFYDGEWVPIDVSGAGNDWNGDLTKMFGISSPYYLQTFIDNTGRDSSFDFLGIHTISAIQSSDIKVSATSFYRQYTITPFNPVYVKVCQNGTTTFGVNGN